MNLDDELRNALRREEPPAGFAERVLARAAAQAREPARPWWRLAGMRVASVAACAVLLVAAGVGYRQWQGETAKHKALLALGIAGGDLHAAQIHVRHMLAERAGAGTENFEEENR
jgi:anti-sigma-K factor RskA